MTARIAALRETPWTLRMLLLLLSVGFVASIGLRFGAGPADANKRYQVPQNATVESNTGVRFAQAAVVGDGGLVELTYTVLDGQKASRFQSDVKHPPVLYNERNRGKAVYRTALMRQGHDLRPGQTYFILYQNNAGAVVKGSTIEIDAGGGKLVSVPVR
jgi:hypothetical protein